MRRDEGSSLVPDDSGLEEVVRRIVEVARPERIVLFGSAARGTPAPDSDLDLLVVKRGAHRRRLTGEIYARLVGVGRAVDVVVVTPEDIERFGNSPALIIEPALREGRVVYAA
jgi:predicted nucleotidyltransferase